jgi:hypothetical protein
VTASDQDPEEANPLEAALDLFVYAPVGLALTAAEEIPKLAARGRATVQAQMTMARIVGRFAVVQGRREVERRLGGPRPTSPASRVTTPLQSRAERTYDDLLGSGSSVPKPGAAMGPEHPERPADELAIPGYDSLSASQVVQRLAGLSREELTAVGEYEEAHRGRRTVLTRIRQLQGG